MKQIDTITGLQSKNIIRIVLGAGLILLIPLVAMQFSDDVDWGLFDFVIIGTLLISTGLLYELLKTKVNAKYRIVVAGVLVIVMLLIWAELAVGLFGTPFAGS
jgi:hypothetical protein